MAFHQPTRQVQQPRIARAESEDGGSAILSPQARLDTNEPHTWVLFTPGTDAGTTTSYLSSVQDDQITPGRSRISDLGSLDTAARSDFNSQPSNSVVPSVALVNSIAEDDAELDSLDSHLPDFRTAHSPYHQPDIIHSTHIFPGHDGLGSFRFEVPGNSVQAQERMYAFEQFNPNRVMHRRESFDLARLQLESQEPKEAERNQRIEAWRLEQSQLLLEDIKKETKRRRRQSELSAQRARLEKGVLEDVIARSVADEEAEDINLAGTEWHDQDEASTDTSKGGLWSRLTRKVICDMMGIDDKLLAILFGEVLPDENDMKTPRGSPKDSAHPAFANKESESRDDSTWQLHMLERIANELGGIVHQMSTHPGAFSTYSRVQQTPLPYAGLPMIPEAPDSIQRMNSSAASMPQFKPTIGQSADAGVAQPLNAIPSTSSDATPDVATSNGQTFTQQEWEQDLDIRLVFRYLRSRFTSSRPSSPPFTSGTSHLATSSTQELAAKAARIRQHHPLVSHAHANSHGHHRPRPAERRSFRSTTPANPVTMRHGPGSCASQSTRRSARRSSMSSRQSSRHFWDIGGSIGTGSIIASAGPIMGSWGEV
ncbi:uncharacterized protein PODANS_2_13200 [Podospora anserina S mat+]|uniref:Podospora anserina S mat+ genomic DNA chromosome 2, supercontig 2 n=1 Tax=Podospora anserina (strain S / ATCC MYA-4624 / DSM 980 / FGSC 10383) TaxID=515849 RepID=B2B838_PODAN|nr:uncharacterized protein PODANS_2_13200 [Podospora anserina S mat+]CAP73967.1 unnamed protein product [Podospora anserina S mat+]CDP26368.1 Putative protein of unknown function [Podospora anserina S mat+]